MLPTSRRSNDVRRSSGGSLGHNNPAGANTDGNTPNNILDEDSPFANERRGSFHLQIESNAASNSRRRSGRSCSDILGSCFGAAVSIGSMGSLVAGALDMSGLVDLELDDVSSIALMSFGALFTLVGSAFVFYNEYTTRTMPRGPSPLSESYFGVDNTTRFNVMPPLVIQLPSYEEATQNNSPSTPTEPPGYSQAIQQRNGRGDLPKYDDVFPSDDPPPYPNGTDPDL